MKWRLIPTSQLQYVECFFFSSNVFFFNQANLCIFHPEQQQICLLFFPASLEALAVHNRRSILFVISLRDPHLLKRRQRREDRAANPNAVLALRWSNHLDAHRTWHLPRQLLLQPLGNTREHGRTTRQHDVPEEVATHVDVARAHGLQHRVVNTRALHANQVRLEENLGNAESLVADDKRRAVGQLVRLLELGECGWNHGTSRGAGAERSLRSLLARREILLEVHAHVTEALLDVAHNLALGGGGEVVPALHENFAKVGRQIASGEVNAHDGMWEAVPLVDRHGVTDAIAAVKHAPRRASGGVQAHHRLDGDIHVRHVKCLEHELSHHLAIFLRIMRRLGQKHGMLLGRNAKLVVEGVMPDLLHIIPVGDDAVLDRVLEGEYATLRLRLVADVALLFHTHHGANAGDHRPTNDGREDRARRVVARESCFAHA
mmetsp:Transcript_14815/g.37149  ORF Transcript_14815/g.37149 Transcript_14815/m.37149 type:complete len:432 (-) Transcript_14815:552-1847(-)